LLSVGQLDRSDERGANLARSLSFEEELQRLLEVRQCLLRAVALARDVNLKALGYKARTFLDDRRLEPHGLKGSSANR